MSAPRLSFQRILVPVTLTAESCLALPEAVRLVKKYGGEIVLFHVVRLNIVGEERGIPLTQIRKDLARDAHAMLARLMDEFSDSGIPIEICIGEGIAGEMIVKKAVASEADLIVMTTRRHPRWLKPFCRNTARYVLENRPCPVWLLTPDRSSRGSMTVVVDARTSDKSQEPDRYENAYTLRPRFRI